AGKPSTLSAGQGVRVSEDGIRFYADQEGYVCLNGDQLILHALRILTEKLPIGTHTFPGGAVLTQGIQQVEVQAGSFVAIKGAALGCHIRARGDLWLSYAENCSVIADGDVYVTEALAHCDIKTPKRVVALGSAQIVGGKVSALAGVHAVSLGTENFTATEI